MTIEPGTIIKARVTKHYSGFTTRYFQNGIVLENVDEETVRVAFPDKDRNIYIPGIIVLGATIANAIEDKFPAVEADRGFNGLSVSVRGTNLQFLSYYRFDHRMLIYAAPGGLELDEAEDCHGQMNILIQVGKFIRKLLDCERGRDILEC